ncbi:MAG: hypothetical protein CL623_12270 [Arcobacter sp.]|nr:hypothetical protein [Arcobacter sp.]|tara:strand:+ start:8962 stop:12054 length:3093 start_codon:yes stop_codon:yes gene_type:complete
MKFITDEEINLNLEDSLQTKKYVKTLKDVIESSESKYTIGLFGEWGTGKSSIVKTAQEELEKEKPNDIKFIVYDAWKYSGDSFRRMFIRTLSEKLGFNLKNEIDNFYYDKVEEVEKKKFDDKTLYTNIGIFTAISIVIFIGLTFLFKDATTSTKDIGLITIIPLVISSIAIFLNNTYKTEKKTIQYNKFFAPEQFENLTNNLLSKCIKDYPKIDKMKDFFNGKSTHVKNLEKIVIVIDNIDRCEGETAYQLLTNIKNFIANKEGIIFLIPIDDSALKRHLSIENGNKSKEADEFLRKFFNVSLKIKYFQPTDLFQFTNHLNQKHELGLNPNTIDIISKEYATNPRRIIQMLNNLTTELNLIKNKMTEEFIKENESLISVLLIIREEWIDLYKKIVIEPHILKEMKSDSNLQEEEKKFFQKAKTIIEKSNILSIERIVLNIDNNSLLPQEIIDYLEEEDYASIKTSIEEKEITFNNICEYTIEELNKEITRKTYETSVMSRFLNILNLNEIQALSESNLVKIKNIIDTNLDDIIKNIEEESYDLLFKFSMHNKTEKLLYLFLFFKKSFNVAWSTTDVSTDEFIDKLNAQKEIIINGFSHFLKKLEPSEIDRTLSKVFQNYYLYHNNKNDYYIKQEEIDINILKKLKFDLVCPYLIDKLDFTINNQVDINDYLNDDYNELKFIMDNSLVSLKEIEIIFEKFNLTFPTFAKNQEDVKKSLTEIIANFFEDMSSSISNIKPSKHDSTIIETFINKVNTNIQFAFSNSGNRDNYNFNNEIRRDISYQNTFLNFYIQIYSSTSNNTQVSDKIKNLIVKYPNLRNKFYQELISLNKIKNTSFVRLFDDEIFNDTNYNNELLLDLLKIVFLDKNNKDEDIEKISNKLNSILRHLLSTEDNKKEYAFIEELLSNEKIKGLVSNEILKFEFQEILEFNSSIRRLAYDDFVENNKLFDLENSILIDMIKTDEEKYSDEVIKVAKSYILDKNKITKGLNLLDELTISSNEDKTFFKKELLQYKEDENLKEQINEHYKKLEVA